MKSGIKIVIDTKDTRKMCSDKKRLSEGCITCFSEIQESVNSFLANIEERDTKQRAKMADEWTIFLANAEDKLGGSILRSEKETDKINSNSKWILGIVLGVTFCLGAAVGVIYKEVAQKADKKEVITVQEYKFLHDLTRAYNANQFVQNPNAKVDSSNYELIVNAVLGGAMRSAN